MRGSNRGLAEAVRGAALVVVCAGSLVEVAQAQFGVSNGQVIQVTDSRPLAAVAKDLTGRYGVPVSYEDPLTYTFEGDLGGSVETERRRGFPSAPARDLRTASLTFTAEALEVRFGYPPHPAARADVSRVLQSAIDSHMLKRNPGQFKIIETVGGLDIVPVANRDNSGNFELVRSLLDTRISFPEIQGGANAVLNVFARALASATGKMIACPYEGQLRSGPVSASNEVARDVLARIVTGLTSYGATPETLDRLIAAEVAWTLVAQPGLVAPHYATYRIDLRVGGLDTRYSPARNMPGRAIPIPRSSCPSGKAA